MRDYIKNIIYLTHFFLINVRCQTLNIPPGSHEFFITEIVRVKRQAGYVYNRPNIPFELPSQVPIVSTQAPTVDRTQVQHMFYAYPAPAAGGTQTTDYNSAAVQTPTTTNVSNEGDGGYNYGSNTIVTGESETIGSGQNQIATTAQSSSGSSGYSYNAQAHIDAEKKSNTLAAGQTATSSTATSSVSSSYRYDVPSSGTPVEDKSESSGSRTSTNQHSNSVSSQSTTDTLSTGYDYIGPAPTLTNTDQSSGTIQTDINPNTSQSLGTNFSGYSNSVSGYSGTNTGNTVSSTGSSETATSSVSSSYHYDSPISSNTGPTTTILRSLQPTNSITQGYNYNDPVHSKSNTGQATVDPTEITTNTDSNPGVTYSDNSGYNIKAPSPFVSNVAQISKGFSAPQMSSSSSTATSSVTTSYRYEAPKQTVSNLGTFEVSTNAPKYLPPNIQGSVELNNRGISGGLSVSLESSSGTPLSSYVPPIASGTSGPAPVFPSKTYLASANKVAMGAVVSCIESDCAGSSISRPSPLYTTILGPSDRSMAQLSHSSSASSYSSSGAPPSSSYIPSTNIGKTTITTPGKNYLLPQGSSGPSQQRLSVNQPTQSYITPSKTAVNNQPISLSTTSSGSFGHTAAPGRNPNYLPPNSLSSNANTAALAQTNNYLPPKQPSSIQQASFFVPAATYLPPVF